MTENYTTARAWIAEGARVGLITCRRCGAAVFIDPYDNPTADVIHDDWHQPPKEQP